MSKKILFVLTSSTGPLKVKGENKPTGWFLPELVHALNAVKKAGYEVDLASPLGKAPLDQSSVESFKDDPECKEFLNDKAAMASTENTLKLSDVDEKDYAAIFYVGGHGPCFDLVSDKTSIDLIGKFFEAGKPTSAVCHGPVVFSNAKVDGEPLVKGRKLTCFSNDEEEQAGLTEAMPFLVESDIREKGGIFKNERKAWGEEVVVDRDSKGRILITGANPASASATGKAIVDALKG